MRYGIHVPNFGPYADVRLLADLAAAAEQSGWDGFFLWDHVRFETPQPMVDPWVALTAIALRTERIRLGPLVTPLPRRRPGKLAHEAATLDQLSRGRLVQGVGIGGDWWGEFSAFGESADDRVHGAMLDECLEVLSGLWGGEPFSYSGEYYQIRDVQLLPGAAQRPRPPVWVAGVWPNHKPFRRAARWDGVCPMGRDAPMGPADVRAMLDYIGQHRSSEQPFDVVMGCGWDLRELIRTGAATPGDYAEAGVTWWLEGFDWNDPVERARAAIERGPGR